MTQVPMILLETMKSWAVLIIQILNEQLFRFYIIELFPNSILKIIGNEKYGKTMQQASTSD